LGWLGRERRRPGLWTDMRKERFDFVFKTVPRIVSVAHVARRM